VEFRAYTYSVKTNYILIDFENVRVNSLDKLSCDDFRLWVFLGHQNTRLNAALVLAIQELGDRAVYVRLATGGKNALDFHLAYYLGELAKADPNGVFHIISKDKGFDPLIQHLRSKKIAVARSVSFEKIPCFAASKKAERPTSDEELLKAVITDLIRRRTSRPRTAKTLFSTIRARCGAGYAASRIDAIYAALLEKGYVSVDNTRVTYNLPVEA
jgi:hypothetical protein